MRLRYFQLDEKREKIRNQHELNVHDRNLGLIGKCPGSTNASLNIAFVIVGLLSIALFVCLLGGICSSWGPVGPYIERLIAAILTVGGFIFGVQQGSGSK